MYIITLYNITKTAVVTYRLVVSTTVHGIPIVYGIPIAQELREI